MKILLHLICLTVLLLGLVGCSTNNPVATSLGATPSPARSEYFESEIGSFIFNRGQSGKAESCYYLLGLKLVKTPTGSLYLRTRFENPADSANPLIVDSVLSAGEERCKIESPLMKGLRARSTYKIEVLVFDSPERTQQIGTHIQYLRSMVLF